MFKIAIEAPDVILVSLLLVLTRWSGVLFADFQHLNATFKTNFSVTTVKLTVKQFPAITNFFSQRVPSYVFHRAWTEYCNMIHENFKKSWRAPPMIHCSLGKIFFTHSPTCPKSIMNEWILMNQLIKKLCFVCKIFRFLCFWWMQKLQILWCHQRHERTFKMLHFQLLL